MGDLIGYARASTGHQHLDLQRDALTAAGCIRIFSDVGGGTLTSRPALDRALDHLRAADTLTVWRLDRLGRNVLHSS